MALENSVTMGVISSVDRQLKPEDPGVCIQTDAPINPGDQFVTVATQFRFGLDELLMAMIPIML